MCRGGGSGLGGGVRMDVNEELKFLWKIQKKKNFFFFFGGGGFRGGSGSGTGCGGGGGSGWIRMKNEVFVKIQKKNWGDPGGCRVGGVGLGGVRVDVNEELKFLGKFKKI